MGIFDKIKDALDGDDVENAQKRVDEATKDAAEAKKDLEEAKAERRTETDKDKSVGDDLKDKADHAKKEPEPADKPKANTGGGPKTYTVKSGDTLSEIGARYGVSYMDIANASGIENPDLIFPGQVLTIPQK